MNLWAPIVCKFIFMKITWMFVCYVCITEIQQVNVVEKRVYVRHIADNEINSWRSAIKLLKRDREGSELQRTQRGRKEFQETHRAYGGFAIKDILSKPIQLWLHGTV